MSISIGTVFDPLSDSASRAASSTPLVIMQSDAGRLLQHELTRYCTGQISGRSFLIAGHRGAGKTTMVMDALRRVTAVREPDDMRPLVVHLHGPSLFETAVDEPATSRLAPDPDTRAKRQARAQKTTEEESNAERLARRALVQIILGLHRATIKEFALCYRRAYLRHLDVMPFDTEMEMLVAQFEMELLEDPSAARLHEFYERVGVLRDGLLFGSDRTVNGQASLELLALNGICNAHQRISGDLRRTEKEQENRTSAHKRVIEIKGSEVFKPIAAVLAGAAVTGGAAAAKGFSLGTATLGVLVTLAASFFMNRSRTETSRRERQTDTAFIPDLSLRTLDRLMPVLVDRLHAAGLAPVMIVDELDKVDRLSERIVNVIDCLKKLMAEGVFSCFLTDRSYIEHLRIMDRDKAYARAYSYFSHPLMIVYRPADFDVYLNRLLEIGSAAEDENDRDVLKWVLRRRCELHAMKLNREIASMRTETNTIAFPGGKIRSVPASQVDTTFQVIIELELMRPDLQAWLAQRPTMLQTVYDCLYFLPAHLMRGETEIVFKFDATRQQYETDSLRAWLEERMNLAEAGRRHTADSMALNDDDNLMCQTIVHNIASTLALRTQAQISAEWKKVLADAPTGTTIKEPTTIVYGEMLMGSRALLVLHVTGRSNETQEFKWRYFSSGEPRPTKRTGAADVQQQLEEARKLADAIRKIEINLQAALTTTRTEGELLAWLAEPSYVLETSPTWASVADSIRDVDKDRPNPGEISRAVENIRLYHQQVVAAMERVLLTLESAAFLAGLGDAATLREGMELAIPLLSTGLRFRDTLPPERASAILDFREQSTQLQSTLRIEWTRDHANVKLDGDPGAITKLVMDSLNAGSKLQKLADWDQIRSNAWDRLFLRMQSFIRTSKDRRADAVEILGAAHGEGPTKTIPLDLASVTLHQWTKVLLAPLVGPGDAPAREVPLWVAVLALRQLGIASLGAEWNGRFRSVLQSQPGWLEAQSRIEESLERHAIWKGETSPSARFMLIIRRNAESQTDRFIDMPKRGLALVLTAKQVNEFPQVRLLMQIAGETPWMLVWEQPSDAEGERDELRRSLAGGGQKFSEGWIYPAQAPNLRQPCVVKPQTADEVFDVIGSATQPEQAT